MKYVLTILMIALLFLTACGNDRIADDNSTKDTGSSENTSVVKDEPIIQKQIQCQDDYVEIDGECLPIDPNNVIPDEAEPIIEETPIKAVENPVSNTKVFKVQAKNYRFIIDGKENPEMRVKLNDTVIIELTSIGGSHNWNVRQLAARSATVSTNETTTLEFVAKTAGTFKYYCAVGKHQDIGQSGTFIVE